MVSRATPPLENPKHSIRSIEGNFGRALPLGRGWASRPLKSPSGDYFQNAVHTVVTLDPALCSLDPCKSEWLTSKLSNPPKAVLKAFGGLDGSGLWRGLNPPAVLIPRRLTE